MPRIQQSPYYAARRRLVAGPAGTWALPSPAVEPAAGDRLAPGAFVGVSTGKIVQLTGQPKGAYFVEVRGPRGGSAWVLNTFVRLAPVAGAVVPAQPAPAAPRPASSRPTATAPAAPRTRQAPRPRRPLRAVQAIKSGDGSAALQAIVSNDQKTHAWLVKALYWQAKAAEVSGPTANAPALAKALQAVIASYTARQTKIKSSRLVKFSEGVNSTVKGWLDTLKGLVGMSSPAVVGVLPLAVPILVGVGVGVAAAGALWLLLRNDVAPSVTDLQTAARLTETYRQMSPEEKDLFEKTTKETGEAGQTAGEAAADNSFFGQLKNNVLLIGGGILAFSLLSKKK